MVADPDEEDEALYYSLERGIGKDPRYTVPTVPNSSIIAPPEDVGCGPFSFRNRRFDWYPTSVNPWNITSNNAQLGVGSGGAIATFAVVSDPVAVNPSAYSVYQNNIRTMPSTQYMLVAEIECVSACTQLQLWGFSNSDGCTDNAQVSAVTLMSPPAVPIVKGDKRTIQGMFTTGAGNRAVDSVTSVFKINFVAFCSWPGFTFSNGDFSASQTIYPWECYGDCSLSLSTDAMSPLMVPSDGTAFALLTANQKMAAGPPGTLSTMYIYQEMLSIDGSGSSKYTLSVDLNVEAQAGKVRKVAFYLTNTCYGDHGIPTAADMVAEFDITPIVPIVPTNPTTLQAYTIPGQSVMTFWIGFTYDSSDTSRLDIGINNIVFQKVVPPLPPPLGPCTVAASAFSNGDFSSSDNLLPWVRGGNGDMNLIKDDPTKMIAGNTAQLKFSSTSSSDVETVTMTQYNLQATPGRKYAVSFYYKIPRNGPLGEGIKSLSLQYAACGERWFTTFKSADSSSITPLDDVRILSGDFTAPGDNIHLRIEVNHTTSYSRDEVLLAYISFYPVPVAPCLPAYLWSEGDFEQTDVEPFWRVQDPDNSCNCHFDKSSLGSGTAIEWDYSGLLSLGLTPDNSGASKVVTLYRDRILAIFGKSYNFGITVQAITEPSMISQITMRYSFPCLDDGGTKYPLVNFPSSSLASGETVHKDGNIFAISPNVRIEMTVEYLETATSELEFDEVSFCMFPLPFSNGDFSVSKNIDGWDCYAFPFEFWTQEGHVGSCNIVFDDDTAMMTLQPIANNLEPRSSKAFVQRYIAIDTTKPASTYYVTADVTVDPSGAESVISAVLQWQDACLGGKLTDLDGTQASYSLPGDGLTFKLSGRFQPVNPVSGNVIGNINLFVTFVHDNSNPVRIHLNKVTFQSCPDTQLYEHQDFLEDSVEAVPWVASEPARFGFSDPENAHDSILGRSLMFAMDEVLGAGPTDLYMTTSEYSLATVPGTEYQFSFYYKGNDYVDERAKYGGIGRITLAYRSCPVADPNSPAPWVDFASINALDYYSYSTIRPAQGLFTPQTAHTDLRITVDHNPVYGDDLIFNFFNLLPTDRCGAEGTRIFANGGFGGSTLAPWKWNPNPSEHFSVTQVAAGASGNAFQNNLGVPLPCMMVTITKQVGDKRDQGSITKRDMWSPHIYQTNIQVNGDGTTDYVVIFKAYTITGFTETAGMKLKYAVSCASPLDWKELEFQSGSITADGTANIVTFTTETFQPPAGAYTIDIRLSWEIDMSKDMTMMMTDFKFYASSSSLQNRFPSSSIMAPSTVDPWFCMGNCKLTVGPNSANYMWLLLNPVASGEDSPTTYNEISIIQTSVTTNNYYYQRFTASIFLEGVGNEDFGSVKLQVQNALGTAPVSNANTVLAPGILLRLGSWVNVEGYFSVPSASANLYFTFQQKTRGPSRVRIKTIDWGSVNCLPLSTGRTWHNGLAVPSDGKFWQKDTGVSIQYISGLPNYAEITFPADPTAPLDTVAHKLYQKWITVNVGKSAEIRFAFQIMSGGAGIKSIGTWARDACRPNAPETTSIIINNKVTDGSSFGITGSIATTSRLYDIGVVINHDKSAEVKFRIVTSLVTINS